VSTRDVCPQSGRAYHFSVWLSGEDNAIWTIGDRDATAFRANARTIASLTLLFGWRLN
jgi:hypothetical protein